MTPPRRNRRRGLLDEFADDLFALVIMLITLLIIIAAYQASESQSIGTYRTSSFEHKMSRSLNEFLTSELSHTTAAQVITDTENKHAPELLKHWAGQHFSEELGSETPWSLVINYPYEAENTGEDTLEIAGPAKGDKRTVAQATLPARDGGLVEVHLLVGVTYANKARFFISVYTPL
ncbi:MAG: hypothetical protein ACLFO2_00535 [Candidatus Woesearchaeota archaeon]